MPKCEWKEVKLEDIVLSANTGLDAIRRAPIVEEDTGIKCLRIQDISQSKKFENWGNSKVKESDFEKARLRKGDLIMARTCSPGIVLNVKADMNAVFNNGLARIRPKLDRVTSDYLYYLFKSRDFIGHIYGISTGTSVQLNMKLGDLLSYEFNLPVLAEQRAIASVLSSLDDKIGLLHRQNQTLEQISETLFRQWFVEEADEGWEWHQLDEYVEVQRGLSYKGAGLTDADNGIPMHNLNSVFEGGGYKEAGIKYYKGEFKERHKVYPGDVIITNTEQGHEHLLIGYPAIVPTNFGEYGIFSQHIYRLAIKSRISNFFLFHLLKTHDLHEQIAGATNGSTVNMLSKDGVEWVKFRMPQQKMIDEFTQIAKDHFKKQELNQTKIRTLTAMRDTLLPKLMSGEIRIV